MRVFILACLLLFIAPPTQARDCQVPGLGRGGNWVKIEELTRSFRCIIAEIEALKKQKLKVEELERQVEALRRRVPTEYINNNGKVLVEPDQLIGKATIIVDARRSGEPRSLPIDQVLIEELCGARSCQIALALESSGALVRTSRSGFQQTLCQFLYVPQTGEWTVATGCTNPAGSGIDGDGSTSDDDTGADTLLETGEACLFADADYRILAGQSAPSFLSDRSQGLFVISVPDRRPDLTVPFQCVLEIYRTGIL